MKFHFHNWGPWSAQYATLFSVIQDRVCPTCNLIESVEVRSR